MMLREPINGDCNSMEEKKNTYMVYFQPVHTETPLTAAKGTESKSYSDAIRIANKLNNEYMGDGLYCSTDQTRNRIKESVNATWIY